jgi:glycosyltransferase involved in cell wall biosynthesis
MATARVVVVIPIFNGANTLSRAIDSALNQTFDGHYEILAVNDGSTDATAELLGLYEKRIKILEQPNRGPAAARNAAVAQTDAEYIAFLDADDAFTRDKLARSVPQLAGSPDAVMLFHNAIALTWDGRQVTQSYVWPERAYAPTMDQMLARWWPIVPSTVVMRRSAFEACGGFCEQFRGPGYEDCDLWIRAREHGEFVFSPAPLTYYTTSQRRTTRMEKYISQRALFFRRMRRLYGHRADELIRSTVRNYTNWLGYQGLLAMQRREPEAARAYFARILRHQPTHLKSALRLLRTFLPIRMARALSGRTAGARLSAGSTGVSQTALPTVDSASSNLADEGRG